MHNTFKLTITLTQQEIREWSQPHWWKRYHSVNVLPWKDLLSVLTLLCGHWLQAWVCCLPRGQSPNLGSQVVKREYSGQTFSSVNLQLLNVVVLFNITEKTLGVFHISNESYYHVQYERGSLSWHTHINMWLHQLGGQNHSSRKC